jgi:L-iditol 2-dehydrogenase
MKAAFIHGIRDIRTIDTHDAQEPGIGEVLVEVTAVGVCGSDLHGYLFGDVGGIVNQEPLILGHEAAGRILMLGPQAPDHLKVGQRVAIDPATPCLECERCLDGQPHLCLQLKFMGLWPYHGALRERMVHPARCVFPVPDSISDVGTAMLEPLGVALHAMRLAKIEVGEDVAVLGCGGVGLLLIRLARLQGARRIFAADRYAWRLDMAANFGADHVFNIEQHNVVDEVMRVTHKRGVDVALEAAWVEHTANQCVQMARYGGRAVIVGIPAKDELSVQASAARRKEVPILYSRRMKHVYPTTSVLAYSGQVNVDALASHRFTLDQAKAAFDTAGDYHDQVLRAMICPTMK